MLLSRGKCGPLLQCPAFHQSGKLGRSWYVLCHSFSLLFTCNHRGAFKQFNNSLESPQKSSSGRRGPYSLFKKAFSLMLSGDPEDVNNPVFHVLLFLSS